MANNGAYGNAFDDPAVQKAATHAISTAAQNPEMRNAMFNAAVDYSTKPNPPPPPASQPSNQQDNVYGNGGWDPENQEKNNSLPEEKSCWEEAKQKLGWCSAKMPLMYLLCLTGVAFVCAGIFDFMSNFDNPLDLFVNIYLIVFGLLVCVIELPRFIPLMGKIQDRIFYWAMFMSRLWGRAWFYFFLSVLCLSDGKGSTPKLVVAILVIFVVIIMFFVGYSSAAKAIRFNIYISQGAEGPHRLEKIESKFRELDNTNMGFITDVHLKLLAEEADRECSTSELQTIVRFFNKSMDNEISLEEWMDGFEVLQKGVRSL